MAQYRTAAVGAFGVPSVAKKAGNECPVLAALFGPAGAGATMSVRGVRTPTLSLPLCSTSEKGPKAVNRAKHRAALARFWLAARHPTTEVARADAKLENCSNFQEDHGGSGLHSKNKDLLCEM